MTTTTKTPIKKMTAEEVRQKGIEICNKINEAVQIGASVFSKAPAGVQVCILSIDKDKFRIWPGFADIEIIDANPKFRQVVLRVVEEKRKIEKYVKSHVPSVRRNEFGKWVRSYGDIGIAPENMPSRLFHSGTPTREVLMSEINISLPEGTRYTASIEDRYEELVSRPSWIQGEVRQGHWELYDWVKITAHVPASDMVLLAGYDEGALFICELPKVVSSVEQAHEVLLPPEVKRASSYERQGEWFFVPVSEAEVSRIAKVMSTGKLDTLKMSEGHRLDVATKMKKLPVGIEGCSYGSYIPLENGSSHRASTYVEITSKSGSIKYVSGFITDTRTGHHKPLFLNGWHRVHRNTEVVRNLNSMNSARTSRRRYWD